MCTDDFLQSDLGNCKEVDKILVILYSKVGKDFVRKIVFFFNLRLSKRIYKKSLKKF